VFGWQEHLDRLHASARALHFEVPLAPAAMFAEVARTVAAYRVQAKVADDVYIRLQLSRGAGPIGLDVDLASAPEYTLLVQPCPRHAEAKLRTGIRLSIATALKRNPIESLSPAWKTGNYLNNLLGLREARTRGADEVLMLNLAGEITEASTSNVAFVRGGEIVTPRLDAGILAGVTRRLMLEKVAARVGLRARETAVRPGELADMEECFLLSTTKDVTPVGAIDGRAFRVGPDTVSMRLKAAFADYMAEYAAAHPQQKV
jgi:branched-subunit amino acid aminotransferase/4-amino-4-deoxychorismate lyase